MATAREAAGAGHRAGDVGSPGGNDSSAAAMEVVVVYAAPGVEDIVRVALPAGAVVGDALAASGLLDRHALDLRLLVCALHGERVPVTLPLRTGDRVELTRPLLADAKAVRRRRAAERPLPRPRPPGGRRGGPPA